MDCLIVGGGIGGLTAALSLHAVGLDVRVVESAPALAPIGVGINLLPHATRELVELELGEQLAAAAIETGELVFCDWTGKVLGKEPRGLAAGYRWPQYSIHRGELQMLLLEAVTARLGAGAVRTGLTLERFEERGRCVAAELRDTATGALVTEQADVLVGADGLHSVTRAQLHPGEGPPLWNGVHMWRGAIEAPPFLTGSSMVAAVGRFARSKLVAYPMSRAAATPGCVRVNWVAEVKVGRELHRGSPKANADVPAVPSRMNPPRFSGSVVGHLDSPPDWKRRGRADEVLPHYRDWSIPWLDVAALLGNTAEVWRYPMVDRDPLPHWGRGRVTLLGDAAHPMYPIGSNGASQAIVDARVLAWNLATQESPEAALAAYEAARREPTTELVLSNRGKGPEQPGRYKRVAGFDVEELNQRRSWSVPG